MLGGGFDVRVSQDGTRSFAVMCGPEGKLKTIGRFPSMNLKTARQEAQRYLLELPKLSATPASAPSRSQTLSVPSSHVHPTFFPRESREGGWPHGTHIESEEVSIA